MGVFAPNSDGAQACWTLHAAIGRGETHCQRMPRVYFSPHICNYLHWLLQILANFKNYRGNHTPAFTLLLQQLQPIFSQGRTIIILSCKRLMVHPETEHKGQKAKDEAKSSTRGQPHSVSKGSCDKKNVQQ